jgi:predicted PurR-regulated permease PerM
MILRVEYGATLAIFAAFAEVVPYVGPFLAWLVAMPIVLNQAPLLALWVTLMFLIIQRLENDILVPIIMKQATGLSPILVIFSMMVGFQFMGVVGLILSIPVASTIAIFVGDYTARKK